MNLNKVPTNSTQTSNLLLSIHSEKTFVNKYHLLKIFKQESEISLTPVYPMLLPISHKEVNLLIPLIKLKVFNKSTSLNFKLRITDTLGPRTKSFNSGHKWRESFQSPSISS